MRALSAIVPSAYNARIVCRVYVDACVHRTWLGRVVYYCDLYHIMGAISCDCLDMNALYMVLMALFSRVSDQCAELP